MVPEAPVRTEGKAAQNKALGRLFGAIFFVQIAINFDSGAVPAMLDQIKTDLALEPWEMGMMGGVQYIGLVIMSPIAGVVLQKYSSKTVLALALWLNLLCVVCLATGANKWLLMMARLGIGITQTTPCVYAPVWVDEFALEGYATTWMSVLQAGVPLGVMVGYATGGGVVSGGLQWQTAIWVQVTILGPLAIGSLLVPSRYLDVNGNHTAKPEEMPHLEEEEQADEAAAQEQQENVVRAEGHAHSISSRDGRGGGSSDGPSTDELSLVEEVAEGSLTEEPLQMPHSLASSSGAAGGDESPDWSGASAKEDGSSSGLDSPRRGHSESVCSVYSEYSDAGSVGDVGGDGSMDATASDPRRRRSSQSSQSGKPHSRGGGRGRRKVRRSLIPNPEAARGRDRLASLCGYDRVTAELLEANSSKKGAGEGMPIELAATIAVKQAQFGMCRQLQGLLRSRMWLSITLGLCALYFVVTGVQVREGVRQGHTGRHVRRTESTRARLQNAHAACLCTLSACLRRLFLLPAVTVLGNRIPHGGAWRGVGHRNWRLHRDERHGPRAGCRLRRLVCRPHGWVQGCERSRHCVTLLRKLRRDRYGARDPCGVRA